MNIFDLPHRAEYLKYTLPRRITDRFCRNEGVGLPLVRLMTFKETKSKFNIETSFIDYSKRMIVIAIDEAWDAKKQWAWATMATVHECAHDTFDFSPRSLDITTFAQADLLNVLRDCKNEQRVLIEDRWSGTLLKRGRNYVFNETRNDYKVPLNVDAYSEARNLILISHTVCMAKYTKILKLLHQGKIDSKALWLEIQKEGFIPSENLKQIWHEVAFPLVARMWCEKNNWVLREMMDEFMQMFPPALNFQEPQTKAEIGGHLGNAPEQSASGEETNSKPQKSKSSSNSEESSKSNSQAADSENSEAGNSKDKEPDQNGQEEQSSESGGSDSGNQSESNAASEDSNDSDGDGKSTDDTKSNDSEDSNGSSGTEESNESNDSGNSGNSEDSENSDKSDDSTDSNGSNQAEESNKAEESNDSKASTGSDDSGSSSSSESSNGPNTSDGKENDSNNNSEPGSSETVNTSENPTGESEETPVSYMPIYSDEDFPEIEIEEVDLDAQEGAEKLEEEIKDELDDANREARPFIEGLYPMAGQDIIRPSKPNAWVQSSAPFVPVLVRELKITLQPRIKEATRMGRLNVSRIIRFPDTDNPFDSKTSLEMDAGRGRRITVICDTSGSMKSGGKMTAAKVALMTTHLTCRQIETRYQILTSRTLSVLASDEMSEARCSGLIAGLEYHPYGDNYVSTLPVVLKTLKQEQKNEDQIVIIITDGQPGGINELQEIVTNSRSSGFLIVGMGLNLSSTESLGMETIFGKEFYIQGEIGSSIQGKSFAEVLGETLTRLVRMTLKH